MMKTDTTSDIGHSEVRQRRKTLQSKHLDDAFTTTKIANDQTDNGKQLVSLRPTSSNGIRPNVITSVTCSSTSVSSGDGSLDADSEIDDTDDQLIINNTNNSYTTNKNSSSCERDDRIRNDDDDNDYNVIPELVRPILRLYRSVPNLVFIPVPLLLDVHEARKVTEHNLPRKWRRSYVTFSFASMFTFMFIDYSTGYILKQYTAAYNVSFDTEIRMIAGSITTIIHSSILVPLLAICLYYNSGTTPPPPPTTTKHWHERNNRWTNRLSLAYLSYIPSLPIFQHYDVWWQDFANALLEFCTGYMVYDAFVQFYLDRIYYHNSTWRTTEWMFLGHHGATALYMGSARWVQAGQLSALALMLFGEATAPIMNILRISFTLREQHELLGPTSDTFFAQTTWLTQTLHPHLEYLYALLYFPIRAIIAPILILYITYDLLLTKHGRYNVPIFVSIIWVSLCWAVAIGSYSWIVNCYNIITTGTGTAIG